MQITSFFVALKKKTYAFRLTNQNSKSCGIGQKKNSAALINTISNVDLPVDVDEDIEDNCDEVALGVPLKQPIAIRH